MAYQFQQPPGGAGTVAAPALRVQSLLASVLGITAVGLCITALAVYLFQGHVSGTLGLIAMIVGFVLLISINATRANQTLSLVLFYAFAFCWGIGLAPTIGHYVQNFGPEIVYNAALTTGLGMFALAAVVYVTGLDLRRFQGILMLALMGLVLVGIVSIFFRFISPDVYSWITLVLFTGFVLIDFARIRAGGDGLTPVQMAVSIYLDFINIFLAILQIFGGRRSRS